MDKKCFIYGLVDPRDNEVRYVGRSVNPPARWEQHIKKAIRQMHPVRRSGLSPIWSIPSPKNYWIYWLLDERLLPGLILLDSCDRSEAKQREQDWIDHYVDSGHYLTNSTRGAGKEPLNADWFTYWRSWQLEQIFSGKWKPQR